LEALAALELGPASPPLSASTSISASDMALLDPGVSVMTAPTVTCQTGAAGGRRAAVRFNCACCAALRSRTDF
jgi:hypothetical protein